MPGKIITACGHSYCNQCLNSTIKENGTECPQCRGAFTEKQLVSISEFLRRYDSESYESIVEAEQQEFAIEAPLETSFPVSPDILKLDPTWLSSTKIEKVLELVNDITTQAPQDKIIVFSQFTQFIDLMETPFLARKIGYQVYRGNMTLPQRTKAVEKFKRDPKCKVMIVSLKCGSVGLNLTCANHVIITDL